MSGAEVQRFADLVRVPRVALEVIYGRYVEGDTTRDEESDRAMAEIEVALFPRVEAS